MDTFGENLRSALHSLRSNWLRTVLTMLGVVIGVGSVALLVSIATGVQREVTEQVQALGSNLVLVVPGKLGPNNQPNMMALVGVSTLTQADVDALAALPSVHRVAPFLFVGGTAEYEGRPHSAFVIATTPSWGLIRERPLAEGRFFAAGEAEDAVCVLGGQPRSAIFGDGPAVGKTLTISGVELRVVGAYKEEQQSVMFGSGGFENMIFVPARTAQQRIPRVQVNRIIIQTNPSIPPEQVLGEIDRTLRATHQGREDYGVVTQKQLLATVYRMLRLVTALLGGLTAISLVVAGIGIMNIMLVTVTERTHEIGIRKAVGARRNDIFTQFLIEAVTISSLGGVAGIAVAAVICAVIERVSPLHPVITPGIVGLAFGVCLGVGIIFGTVPAIRAARQDPIAALRYE